MTQENILRYGFASIEALEGALNHVENKIEAAEKANDEAWHAYNSRVTVKADATIAAGMIDATAQKIEQLSEIRDGLEAKLEEWQRDETTREHREIEKFLRR